MLECLVMGHGDQYITRKGSRSVLYQRAAEMGVGRLGLFEMLLPAVLETIARASDVHSSGC